MNFLDTRFPEKVTVTKAKYEELVQKVAKFEEVQARVGQLETGVKMISMQMGFAGKIPGEFSLER